MQTLTLESLLSRNNRLKGEIVARDRMLSVEQSRFLSLQAMVEKNRADIQDYESAIRLCKICVQEQADARMHVERISSALLNGVMQGMHDFYGLDGERPEYSFKLEPNEDEAGAITGFEPLVYKNGVADEPSTYGSGVINLVSFAIRLIYVLLNPTISQVVMFDEPMTNLSPKAWAFVVQFLEDLQRDMDIQIIAITHSGAKFPDTWEVWREGDTSYARYKEAA